MSQLRAAFLGTVRYIPPAFPKWRPAQRRQLTQVTVTEGEPTAVQRYANLGIMAVGFLTALIGWNYRKQFPGFIALGAGTGAIGVGLAFLTLDLIGYRPGDETL